MAFTKETTNNVHGRGDYVIIRREWTIIKDDGVEVSRTRRDHCINPDDDWSSLSASTQAVINAHFTDAIKKEFAALSDSEKSRFRVPTN